MNRIYGKPEEAVIARVDEHPAMPVIRSMTLEEKLQLLHSLRRGESVELPVIDGSSHSPSTTGNELEP
jgi:hypothetical protein